MLDVHSYESFAKEKNFDFDAIQEQVNMNVFGFKLVEARNMIKQAGQKVNGEYLYSSLENFANNLKRGFKDTVASSTTDERIKESQTRIMNSKNSKNTMRQRSLADLADEKQFYDRVDARHESAADLNDIQALLNAQKLLEKPAAWDAGLTHDFSGEWREENLRDLASKAFFSPLFYTIFGRSQTANEGNFQPQIFHKNFDQFHNYFNFLWLGLPIKLFRKAGEAAGILAQQPSANEMTQREGCSEYIKLATEFMLKRK